MKNQGKLVLDNGTEILYSDINGRDVYVNLMIGSGSAMEPCDKRGLAHFAEHIAASSSKTYKTREELDYASGMLGFKVNPSTSFHSISFDFGVLSKNLAKAIPIVLDCIYNPLINPEIVEKEKGIILEESRNAKQGVSYYAAKLFNQVFFRDTSCAELQIGREEHIVGITAEDVKKYHAEHFIPSNLKAYVVGNVNQISLEKLAQSLGEFSSLNKPLPFSINLPELEHSERVEIEIPGCTSANCRLIFRAPKLTDKDAYLLPFLSHVLNNGGKTSLFKRLRNEKGFVYNSGAVYHSDKHVGFFYIEFKTKPENIEACLNESFDLLANANPKKDEMDMVRAGIETDLAKSERNPAAFFWDFVNEQTYGIKHHDYVRKLLGVKNKDLKDLIAKHFSDKYQVTIVRPSSRQEAKQLTFL